MKEIFILLVFFSLLQISCGEQNHTTDAGTDAGTDKPDCTSVGIKLMGTLDGDDVHLDYSFGQQVLTADPDVWILYPDDGGRIRFELQEAPVLGSPVDAVVTLTLGTIDGPDVGNCRSDGFSSELTLWENRAEFEIGKLYESPFCGGMPLDGSLSGCAAW